MFKFNTLKNKFTSAFILLGLIPAIVISIISTLNSSDDVSNKVYSQLTAINQIKKQTITNYFDERKGDMGVLVNIADTMKTQAFNQLTAITTLKKTQVEDYFANNTVQLEMLANNRELQNSINVLTENFANKPKWRALLDQYDEDYKSLLTNFGWYDFFIISQRGTIIYSVTRESDLGQKITLDLSGTSFEKAFNLASNADTNDSHFGDFLPYPPSNNDPAAFAVKPVSVKGKRIGYIAYQQPIDKLNAILGNREGMGETGESYLVGQDKLMRSNSYLNPTEYSVTASFSAGNTVDTQAANSALNGEKGTQVIMDYNDNPVVSSWDYIQLDNGVRWAIISEIDVAEAFNPMTSSNEEFYKTYIEKYGYYDLFLINPNGHIFYTVTKEADFNTNILSGTYASSNLGTLIKKVSQTKQYDLIDFAPYAPSNDEPAAFIAQPLLGVNGEVSLFVALQLPLEGIQTIMGVREGMGQTGESYLVGSDFKMRSNSFLDPKGHSVKASFAGTVAKNGVNTEAVKRALQGEKNTNIIDDYNGNPVLSSFDRIEFGAFNWAIISEIDEPEAFASIRSNTYFMMGLMFIFTLIIGVTGFWFAKRISTPIIEVAAVAERVASGDLTMSIEQTSNDEVGQLQKAIQLMVANLSSMVSTISGISLQQASTSEELAAITTQTNRTVAEQQSISEQLATAMQEMGSTVNEIAQSTATTSTAVDSIQGKVLEGSNKLNETYQSIMNMATQIQESEQSVKRVRSDFDQVVNILGVIKGIADQTNLLALNAAIEAARAGEQGRGFAVVADEVRQLAQRTQDSTKEIDNMINTIVNGANSSVEIMSSSVTHATNVQEHAKEVMELNKVVEGEMHQITDLSAHIATAAEEQAVVVEEILQNVETLNTGVTETSHATDNIAESSVELARLATELEKESSAFTTK
ncbi:methyl-accepting chemotaxis protein [Colwellia sp. 1_MG-2023]|uniref:methyl-accepting chemotaxis protein n=1 Tax=Colwellia sp. 1_MG-2023 TaxID=3062649 RepID=UPI0026E2471E|nr:methyl-accepting chemotaxis protein [Colwellia sp. 1_MG-2023]MDO6444932.1 methyl-accepting chemotaxis protein [Colwellia sp. 1_MG-2023]